VDGKISEEREKDHYFPVYYVEPYRGNEAVLGFDFASDQERGETLERSWKSGEVRSSGLIRLVQEKGHKKAILIVAPVYQKGISIETVADRKENLRGFVLSAHRVGAMVEGALDLLPQVPLEIRVEDMTTTSEGDFNQV